MVITLKRLEEEIERVNSVLRDLCENGVSIDYYNPDYFPGIIIRKDGKRIRGEGISPSDAVNYGSSKRDVHTALERVVKFLEARESGQQGRSFISDYEICGIFKAAFWR